MILFNFRGLLFAGIGLAAAIGIAGWVTGEWHGDSEVSFFVLGALVLAIDLGYRARQQAEPGGWRLFRSDAGGHVFFIPIWLIGLGWIIMGGVDVATGRGPMRAQNDAFMLETIELFKKTTEALQPDKAADKGNADDLLHRSVDRLHELADFHDKQDRRERRRLHRKFGDQVDRLVEQIRLRSAG